MIDAGLLWALIGVSFVVALAISKWFFLMTVGYILMVSRQYMGGWFWEPAPYRVPLPIRKLAFPF